MEYSEFEIQAEVYMRLKSQFPLVRGEYFYEHTDRHLDEFGRIKACRFDIVIFNSQSKILAVVEIKKKKGKHYIAHYGKSVLAPVVLVEGMEDVPKIIQKVHREIRSYTITPQRLASANDFMKNISAYI
jgi:hypothetical protein